MTDDESDDDGFECYCDIGEGEPPEVLVNRWRKARDTHKCCECHEAINPPARYLHTWGIWDGDHKIYKTCEFCARLRQALWDKGADQPFTALACALLRYPAIEPVDKDAVL